MARIVGDDNLTEQEQVNAVMEAARVSEARARAMMARGSGGLAGDLMARGEVASLRDSPIFVFFSGASTTKPATLRAPAGSLMWLRLRAGHRPLVDLSHRLHLDVMTPPPWYWRLLERIYGWYCRFRRWLDS